MSSRHPWFNDTLAANGRQVRENFWTWFGRSAAVDGSGVPRILFHGTSHDIEAFDNEMTIDSGLHFESVEQAHMRCTGSSTKTLIPVYLSITNPRRSRDAGGNWASKIRAAKAAGCDGIVYLNRYEGLNVATVNRAAREGVDLDRLTDAQFKRYVPEARDSFIAFRPDQVKSAIGNCGLYLRNAPSLTDTEAAARIQRARSALRSADEVFLPLLSPR